MTVLVVIPCLNEVANISRVANQFISDKAVEKIVIADGGSTDGTLEILTDLKEKSSKVDILHNPKKIQSAGVNAAVKALDKTYNWLLRVDAHCAYPDEYATTLLEAALEHKADAVVVPMRTIGKSGFQIAAATAQNSVIGTGGSAHRSSSSGQWVDHGHHALMKLDLFEAIGGYCENMPCNEDAELDHRLTQAGGKIWLEPRATIDYFPRKSPKRLWIQYFKYGIGRACNVQRHKMQPRPRQLVPLLVPIAAILALFTPIHWIFSFPFLAWLGLCLGCGILIGLKKKRSMAMFSGVAAAIMHFAWASGFFWQILTRPHGVSPQYGFKPRLTTQFSKS